MGIGKRILNPQGLCVCKASAAASPPPSILGWGRVKLVVGQGRTPQEWASGVRSSLSRESGDQEREPLI